MAQTNGLMEGKCYFMRKYGAHELQQYWDLYWKTKVLDKILTILDKQALLVFTCVTLIVLSLWESQKIIEIVLWVKCVLKLVWKSIFFLFKPYHTWAGWGLSNEWDFIVKWTITPGNFCACAVHMWTPGHTCHWTFGPKRRAIPVPLPDVLGSFLTGNEV